MLVVARMFAVGEKVGDRSRRVGDVQRAFFGSADFPDQRRVATETEEPKRAFVGEWCDANDAFAADTEPHARRADDAKRIGLSQPPRQQLERARIELLEVVECEERPALFRARVGECACECAADSPRGFVFGGRGAKRRAAHGLGDPLDHVARGSCVGEFDVQHALEARTRDFEPSVKEAGFSHPARAEQRRESRVVFE